MKLTTRHACIVMATVQAVLAVSIGWSLSFNLVLDQICVAMFVLGAVSTIASASVHRLIKWTQRTAAVVSTSAFAVRSMLWLVDTGGADVWLTVMRSTIWAYASWLTWAMWAHWVMPVRRLNETGVEIIKVIT